MSIVLLQLELALVELLSRTMTTELRPTAFRGDPDVDELHSFFLPERQFAGDTRWTFGTSLKSAYVNSFEFMNHAPQVQMWRDSADTVRAVSRISFGTGEWFHLAEPAFRRPEITTALIHQADAAFALLTSHESWATVRYQSKTDEIEHLRSNGYQPDAVTEVFMTRSLDQPIAQVDPPAGVQVLQLDTADPAIIRERGAAQIDAFTVGRQPTNAERAWISRSLPHQLGYCTAERGVNMVAVDSTGTVLAFADPFYDLGNRIGEFEPVGTRKEVQRTGLSKAVMTQALGEMRAAGMTQAVVRTGIDNLGAIAAYQSVGFEVTDRLVRLGKRRES